MRRHLPLRIELSSCFRLAVLSALAVLLFGCPPADEAKRDAGDADPVFADEPATAAGTAATDGLVIENARALVTGDSGAVYLTIDNRGEADEVFLGASSPDAEVVEPHETIVEGDLMRMAAAADGFPIAAGGTLKLAPGGKHLMLMGLRAPAGGTLELTLDFATADDIVLDVPVESHAGPRGDGELEAVDHADPGHHDSDPHGGMVHGEAGLAGPVDHEAETDPDPMELDELVEEEPDEGDAGGGGGNG